MHARDLRIEAWARTREACIAEAVSALVGSFAGARPLEPVAVTTFEISGATDEELLTGVLRRVIAGIKTGGEAPVAISTTATRTGVRMRCETADIAGIVPAGSLPQGVSVNGARCEPTAGGWRCAVWIDV
ncbi:MAG TPA: archease [Amycolatopsis sp.]|nr:archease [Amycolatopsis sp.]